MLSTYEANLLNMLILKIEKINHIIWQNFVNKPLSFQPLKVNKKNLDITLTQITIY
jgi:hypothetical protein